MPYLKNHLSILFLVISAVLSTNVSNAQKLTFTANDIVLNGADTIRMGNIELSDCSYSTFHFFFANTVSWHADITLDSDSSYYGFVPCVSPQISENWLSSFQFEPFWVGTAVGYFNESKQGMTCDRQGNLYLAGENISRWDSSTGQITELGALPSDMSCRGDLTFRQGKLYLSSVENTLVEVDLDDPMNSSVVMTFPPGTPDIHGLATVNLECDSVETYAVGAELFNGSTIYRIDFDTWTLEELCHFDFFITGLASYDECVFPDCILTVDLDEDNSTTTSAFGFQSGPACIFPVPISDEDVNIYSEFADIDSVIITLANPATAAEYLTLSIGNNLDVSGSNSTKISLVNNGSSTTADFELAIKEMLYHNDDVTPMYGQREINFIAYFGPYQSAVATGLIPIEIPDFDPGFTIDDVSCNGSSDGSVLSEPVGGTAPYNYAWSTNESNNPINQLNSGAYYVTITDALGCVDIDSVVINEPGILSVLITNPGFDTICNGVGELIAEVNGGTPSYTYSWNNGNSLALNEMLDAGDFIVTVEDANACIAEASYTLSEGSDVQVFIQENICYGEEYILEGQTYTADTSFCLNDTLPNGCDSIRCYNLNFQEQNFTLLSDEICYGDSLLIFGDFYSISTIVNNILTDSNGCDSTIAFTLTVLNAPPIDFEVAGDLCLQEEVKISVAGFNDYLWSTGSDESSITVGGGEYFLTVTDANNCLASDSILIEPSILDVSWNWTDPSCFGADNGTIQVDAVTGGSEPYVININSMPFQQVDYIFSNLSPGIYTLSISDLNGCTDSLTIELVEPEEIYIQTEEDISGIADTPVSISITTNAVSPQVNWSPDDYLNCDTCLENTFIPEESILYEIVITDINGCTVSKSIDVEVNPSSSLFVPNVFTPNRDGINDLLKVYGSPSITNIINLTIIHRNGHVVYQNQNFLPDGFQQGWDGTFLGEKAQSGIYLLYVEYEDVTGEIRQEVYDVALVR